MFYYAWPGCVQMQEMKYKKIYQKMYKIILQ